MHLQSGAEPRDIKHTAAINREITQRLCLKWSLLNHKGGQNGEGAEDKHLGKKQTFYT